MPAEAVTLFPIADAPSPKPTRPPTAHQLLYGAVCDVCGFDYAMLSDIDRANAGKLAASFKAAGVEPETVAAAWDAERAKIEGWGTGQPVSRPSIARLKTIVGAYRKAHVPVAAPGPNVYRVMEDRGLSLSQPDKWPDDVVAMFPDEARAWGRVPV